MAAHSVARHQSAGRLVAVRLALRFAEVASPARDSAGRAEGLVSAEAQLLPGTHRLGPFELQLAVDAAEDVVRFDLVVRNVASEPVFLEGAVVGLRWSGIPTGSLRFLRHGWQSWSFTGSRDLDAEGAVEFPSGPWLRGFHHGVGAPAAERDGWHESDLLSAAGSGERFCVAGLLERGGATGLVYLKREPEAVRVEVEARVETPLAPGERRALETVRFALGDDVDRLLEGHASEHGAVAGARTGAPFQAGWCTWYHFFHEIDEPTFLRNLEALAAAREEIPIDLVQLDDGYQRSVGDWRETNAKFPSGLAAIATAIRDAGFRAGLWTAPFCVVPESRLFVEHGDWLLRRGDDYHRGLPHREWAQDLWVHVLDCSRDDVCEHLAALFADLVELGFGYHKLDFLYTAAMQADSHDPSRTRAERLRRGLEAIRRGCGDEAFLLGCGCPLGPAIGVVDGMRIGPDVAPSWAPEPDREVPGILETVPSTRGAIRSTLARAFMHRRYWLNDPDCLMARTAETGLEVPEVASLATAIAASGGMTVFSDDVPALGRDERTRVREVIALAREVDSAGTRGTARAMGLLEREIPDGLVADTATGGFVALINGSEDEREVALPLADLRLDATAVEPAPLLGTAPLSVEGDALRGALAPHQAAFARVLGRPRLAVFCDFDGTFAVQDVGSTIARRYAGERRSALWSRLEAGELTAWGYNMELLDGLALPEEELDAFLRTIDLDPGAAALVAWCEARAVPFRILSDGFDRNLDRLQELSGLRFPYDANRLWYEQGVWRLAPGGPDPACSCGTGTCKRARIAAFRAAHPSATVVHVGNGRVSDLCASLAADVVFAKDSLAEELGDRGVGYEPFETLHDVVAGLTLLHAKLEGIPQ